MAWRQGIAQTSVYLLSFELTYEAIPMVFNKITISDVIRRQSFSSTLIQILVYPIRREAFAWTNAALLSIWRQEIYIS